MGIMMFSGRLRGLRVGLLAASAALTTVVSLPTAEAFKPSTHVAVANEAIEHIDLVLNPGDTTLRFQIGYEILDINVQVTEAYEAVSNNPEFFRAGAIGPDGFPDPVSGQTWGHTDQVKGLFDIIESSNGAIIPTRRGPMAKF
jgi:hypothetical protein